MRRLARHLFMLVSAMSLLVCVAACGGWLAARASPGGAVGRVGAVGDGIGLWLNRDDVALLRESRIQIPASGTLLPPATAIGPGVVLASFPGSGPVRPLPYWALAACSALLPATWAYRAQTAAARRLRRAGLCPTCGYDLRASPDRCPECGAANTPAQ